MKFNEIHPTIVSAVTRYRPIMESIAEFAHLAEANLARASLEAAGIRAIVADEDANALGALPVRVLVETVDVDRARDVLAPMDMPYEGPQTDGLPGWAILGLVLAALIALGMIVLTLTH